jgi:thiol-disulfide isomerase/thioredoxin
MTTGKVILVTVLAGSISIGVAIFGQRLLEQGRGPILSSGQETAHLDSLPDFTFPDLTGRKIASNTWAGKVLVLNFWATWCPPCLREMPLFVEAQKTYGDRDIQVVGIAIDSKDEVTRFLAEHQVNYPILLGDAEAIEMSRQLGNRLEGLPFTVIFDRLGKWTYAQVGEVTQSLLEEQLTPLLPDGARRQTTAN